ncbi:MAG TPA: DUF2845 domain-containing protein [Crenotrichaceae bacterium]|nr:DUF2845 domain-containing protein [Crenotrichaceae bacterium]
MKMSKWIFILCGLFLLVSETAQALRCDRHVINRGDHKTRVLQYCGEPGFVEQKTEYLDTGIRTESRANEITIQDQGIIGNSLSLESDNSHLIPIHYEIWTYNFGRHRLVHHLTFREGKLSKIEIGGYGYD